ncbi:hypothetical protein PMAYCL1PPCAC_01537, partial [Pristionchus mayeri]
QLTVDPRCAAEVQLQRMNGVLRAAVESNFGEAYSGTIGTLFDSIDGVQPGMIAHCEDLPMLYFARSFVVVLDEAVRQL